MPLPAQIERVAIPGNNGNFVNLIIQHEGLQPYQTPFRITSPEMGNWVSMFDDTIKVKLNPKAKKVKGTEKFLYVENPNDVFPAVEEQFRRYAERNPKLTIDQAIRIFDQTGADGKLEFLRLNGIDTNLPLNKIIKMKRG